MTEDKSMGEQNTNELLKNEMKKLVNMMLNTFLPFKL